MNKIYFLVPIVFLVSCGPSNKEYKFEYETIVKDSVVNLEEINSIYDDYNSTLPYPAARYGIYFSSNRNSSGDNFDIIHKNMDISYHQRDDILNLSFVGEDHSIYQTELFPLISSTSDELGPYYYSGPDGIDYFFYSNDEGGDFDIKFAWNNRSDFGTYNGNHIINGPSNFLSLNSEKDDLYPCIHKERSELYFCSNRDGEVFNIYAAKIANPYSFFDFVFDTIAPEISIDSTLSGTFNDKCPFIYEDLMIFASDRDGGYGGFDLYYSKFIDGNWSEATNFGERINTSYDEYRPITFTFTQEVDLMIFSSDRPKGKGGFDLYAINILDLVI